MTILYRHLDNTKTRAIEGDMNVEGLYTAGIGNEIFLKKIRDEAKLVGSYDVKAKKAFLPTRLFNEQTLDRLSETKEVSGPGTLKTFSTVHITMDGCPSNQPKTVGFITFKGFEGGIVHFIKDNGKKLKPGMKVTPVFLNESDRTGSILDISHFMAGA